MGKNLSNRYSQKLLVSAKKSGVDAIKTASKRTIQKTAKVSGHLIGNKIADKIASASKKSLGTHKLMKLTIKYKFQTRNIYLQQKGNKLLMN